ncbi:MAG: ribosome maturation factor RimM [Bacteroidota bacterium]|nr:ribosome maturation factor RimM [Bacteroidota bacterium]
MDFSAIGYFSKTHGINGQLILKANKDFYFEDVRAVFIETQTGVAPYFVKVFSESNNGFIVHLEDIDSIEKAKLLIGKEVSVDSALIYKTEEEFDWMGFEVIDKKFGILGTVFNVSDNGYQVLLSIKHGEKEIILPLVDAFIEKIDENAKKLFFNAPEGLIDVYLNDI